MTLLRSRSDELTLEDIASVKAQLLETDEEPLDTPWHRAAINLMIDCYLWHGRDRTDYYVGGNMFIYYSSGQLPIDKKKYRGPDFFLVKDVDGTRERKFWWVFEEGGRFPNVIMELLSESTAATDRTTKKDLYERVFRMPEYFLYDPDTRKLEGWRLKTGVYHRINANKKGWLWSEEMQLWVGTWEGRFQARVATWPRFYDADEKLVLTEAETLAAENARLKALLAEKGTKNGKRPNK